MSAIVPTPEPGERAQAPVPPGTRAVFLDALDTMVALLPPWEALGRALPGVEPEVIAAAAREEMAYYREHCHEAGDEDSLRDLRRRCAALLSDRVGTEVSVETVLAAMRFEAFPDALTALPRLRERGITLIALSNWDISLEGVLVECGLAELLDGIVCSAGAGARKPDPAIFEVALELAGCEPGQAIHVGDSPEEDLAGAAAAGVPAILIDRGGGGGDIASLEELVPVG